jgi:hypothetical protein
MSTQSSAPSITARQVRRVLELSSGRPVESVRREPREDGRVLWRVASRDASGAPQVGIVDERVILDAIEAIRTSLK